MYLFFHPSFILDEQTEATRTRLEFNMEIPKSIYVRTRLFEFFKVEDLLEVDPKAKINQLYDLRVKSLGKFPRGRVVFTGLPDKNRLGFIRDEIMHSLLSGERFDTFIPKAITAAEPIFEELRKELEKDVGSWFPGEKYAADMVEDIDEFRRILKFYSNLSDSDARRAIRNFHTRLRFTRNLDKWYESAPEARLWPAPPPRPTVLPNSHEVHDSYEVYYLPYPSSMPDDSRPKK